MNLRARIGFSGLASLLAFLAAPVNAATLYVDLNSTNPISPYADWSTAATTIQDAVDAASDGDQILVTNGVYQSGGQLVSGPTTNRVVVSKAVTVQSIQGPAFTLIEGDTIAMRCVFLADGAVLSGFTLTNGHTSAGDNGGGVFCASTNAIVTNCVLVGNTSYALGGGAHAGTFNNCVISNNTAALGGVVEGGALNDCLITGNSGVGAYNCFSRNCTIVGNSGGGTSGGAFLNSIIYFNGSPNTIGSTFDHCCAPNIIIGSGNFTNAPEFVDFPGGNFRLQNGSPGVNGGYYSTTNDTTLKRDLDGNPRIVDGDIDIGAYENQTVNSTHYVNASNQFAIPPYTTWFTAAKTIGDACIASQPTDVIIVTNGTYSGIGGRVVASLNGNKLLSVNGAQNTIIDCKNIIGVLARSNSIVDGFTIINGNSNGVLCDISGQIYNCIIRSNVLGASGGSYFNCTFSDNSKVNQSGGSVGYATLSNCIVMGNMGWGGPYRCTLFNCIISNNAPYSYQGAAGAGANQCILSNCIVTGNTATNYGGFPANGGGTYLGTNYNCIISHNIASGDGGGAYQSTLYNCIVSGNITTGIHNGGGTYGGYLWNCTVAKNITGGSGGGIYGGTISNSIIYFNSAPTGSNWWNDTAMYNSCTTPAFSFNPGNISNDPAFVDADGGVFQLRCGSPCIDALSTNIAAPATDIRGVPRPSDGNSDGVALPDMGAYEYNPASDMSVGIRDNYTNFSTGFCPAFVAQIVGFADYYWWDFGDGTVISNQSNVIHAWTSPGQYTVTLTAYYQDLGQSLAATTMVQVVQQPVFYVNPASPSPAYPYTNWTKASHTIQAAIDASPTVGRLVWVTNGIYSSGGVIVYGANLNLIALRTNPVTVASVNGPVVTAIDGLGGLVRGAYVDDSSSLIGFTLTRLHTPTTGDTIYDLSGGALWCEPNGVVSNCYILKNTASVYGGGAYGGNFYNCVFLSNSVSSSFSGAGGAAYGSTLWNCIISNNAAPSRFGGGVSQGVLYNCLVASNTAAFGAGVNQSVLHNCLVSNNWTSGSSGFGGGAHLSTLYDCTIAGNQSSNGGGGSSNTFERCVLTGNFAANYGGGTYSGTLRNCIIAKNTCGHGGGGVYDAALLNCTVVNNRATNEAGGIYAIIVGRVTNCIIYYNWCGNTSWSNYYNYSFGAINYTCTQPMPSGVGNITNEPKFVDWAGGDFRLRVGSPCIDAGTNLSALVPTDILGTARPLDGNGDGIAKFDMGAYEFDLLSTVGTAWLTNHGLDPNDPLVFMHDPDGDGFTTLQEWIAGTDPTNALSALTMTSPNGNGSGVDITWQSVAGITYQLERSANLFAQPAFSILATNITGLAGTTTYTDTSATNGGPYFYRVGVP